MNPSGSGWITKLLKLLKTNSKHQFESLEVLYSKLRKVGFLYGSNMETLNHIADNPDYTKEERCKINLLIALYAVHSNTKSSESFEKSLLEFYKEITFHKSTFISTILGNNLESILHKRIHIDNNILTKNFSFFVTNALLFMDVMAYREYLKGEKNTILYLKQFENSIRTLVLSALNSKALKTSYDDSLIKLLESSFRFTDDASNHYKSVIDSIPSELESLYYLDLACMSTWSDLKLEATEQEFLNTLGSDLKIPKTQITESITSIHTFYTTHKNKIALLNSKNSVRSFYDHTSLMVRKLISRNSKRLFKELKESKDLVKLLSQSTHRELNDAEQKQMQEQLLDVLKSIPSLAIFLLPGGALLLPLFVKFIPKLLPSAFDDNRIND
ncbi:LETM1-related biofilm-associated protein [Flavobacteriaceae bacterium]|nr:LETM1-related biofilm-associated protein [Flavobacteriaceae bacterium]